IPFLLHPKAFTRYSWHRAVAALPRSRRFRRSSANYRPERRESQSVYDELVALFIAAKAKRQVIMVTHNANLVINTMRTRSSWQKPVHIRLAASHQSARWRAGWRTRQFGRASARF